jgi:hypothetical protein
MTPKKKKNLLLFYVSIFNLSILFLLLLFDNSYTEISLQIEFLKCEHSEYKISLQICLQIYIITLVW